MTRIIISHFRIAKSSSARDKAEVRINIDVQKEEVINIELKKGNKIALSEVEMDGSLLSYASRQVALYIRDHWRGKQSGVNSLKRFVTLLTQTQRCS